MQPNTFTLSRPTQNRLREFLTDLVHIPSPSGQERAIAERIIHEMTQLGFDQVYTDRIGNVIGRIGSGERPIAMLNGHMDTVSVSTPEAWAHDPFGAEIEDGQLYGVGACDMKGALAAMIYGAHLLQSSQIPLGGDIVVACAVQEETCEGVGMRVLIEEEDLHPNWVVLGEPTGMQVSRGQRGRMEMRLTTHGRSSHAAFPKLGDNAIYAAARLIFALDLLTGQMGSDSFLGTGTLAVTDICSRASSRNAIPDRCEIIIDRRLTVGENEVKALSEIKRIIAREGVCADVTVTEYDITSYTGYLCHAREFYPPWVLAEDDPLVVATTEAVRAQIKHRPKIISWQFSTDGAYTCGVAGIPSVGFGPGDPQKAHTANESVALEDVYAASGVYAQIAAQLLAA